MVICQPMLHILRYTAKFDDAPEYIAFRPVTRRLPRPVQFEQLLLYVICFCDGLGPGGQEGGLGCFVNRPPLHDRAMVWIIFWCRAGRAQRVPKESLGTKSHDYAFLVFTFLHDGINQRTR